MTKLVNFLVPNTISLQKSKEEILLLDSLGVDILEVAIPCKEPFLDGELIRNCHKKALENGTSYSNVFDLLDSCQDEIQMQIVIFLYKEVLDDDFYKRCVKSNIKNLLICDLAEDDFEIKQKLKAYNLNAIVLLTPSLSDDEILHKVQNANYFIYLTSHTNKTGSKVALDYALLEKKAKFIKSCTQTELFIGFSIENIEQVKNLKKIFDGIIIGSKVLSFLVDSKYDELKKFVKEIKQSFIGD